MDTKRGFIPYDGFKLVIAILLLLAIIILWATLPAQKSVAPAPVAATTTEETVSEPSPTQETPPTSLPAPEVELPPLPEPSAGLRYDADSESVINAKGEALYHLNGNKTGWAPLVPDEMNTMQLTSEGNSDWALIDDEGQKYTWDFTTHTWIQVPQDEVAEEPAQEELATTIECDGAAPSHLSSGGEAEVISNVNFRSSPGKSDNWLATLQAGDHLKIIGETVCLPYGHGAYLWWQLEREDGTIGWTAEAPITGKNYFIETAE